MNSEPNWLSLTSNCQRSALLQLLRNSPLSLHKQANKMLVTAPWPTDADDAKARAATVIRYLTDGYQVGDRHPATEHT